MGQQAGRGNKQDERRGNIFGETGEKEVLIQKDWFVLREFNSPERFQISCDYETENVYHMQNFS